MDTKVLDLVFLAISAVVVLGIFGAFALQVAR